MPVALYMDENVSRTIADELRKQGIDVITIQEDGLMGVPDSDILDRATQLNRVVFTYDLILLARSATAMERECSVLWINSCTSLACSC